MTAAIGLPMKKRAGAPATYAFRLPSRAEGRADQDARAFKPEPALLLRGLSGNPPHHEEHGAGDGLSPHAFSDMGEEDLRFHFLVQLNGAFQGQATGETFNFQARRTFSHSRRREEHFYRRV